MKKWQEKNREKLNIYNREYSLKNKERLDLYRREYYQKNKKIRFVYMRGYRVANKESMRISRREWLRNNPQRVKVYYHNRRLRTQDLTLQTIQQVYEDNIKRYGTLTCYLCLKPIEFKQDCLEHKTPLSRGGTNDRDNLDIAHRNCNTKKYDRTEAEFKELQ